MYKHGIVYTTVLCITLSLFSLCSNYALFKNFEPLMMRHSLGTHCVTRIQHYSIRT